MSNYNMPTPEGKDPGLWEIAQKRAKFKRHLMVYIIMNAFFWALWFFTGGVSRVYNNWGLPWPIWPALGWGIGLAFQYADAYVFPKANSIENEYEKLKNNK
jgi:hypothetical protein